MSVEKDPAIGSLTPGSLCHGIYTELYNRFFNAQDRRDDEHPWGVEEGDETSIRLHNTAYGFAAAIAGAVGGDGDSGSGILIGYLCRSGGDMSGLLRAHYGFEAGTENRTLLAAYAREDGAGVRFAEDIDVRGGILLSGHRVLCYDPQGGRIVLSAAGLDLGDTLLTSRSSILIGDTDSGVRIAPTGISIGGNEVFHGGNSNRSDADWTMRDAAVAGTLHVAGTAELSDTLRALHGAELGLDGRRMLLLREEELSVVCHLSFGEGYGVRMGGVTVLGGLPDGAVQLSGAGSSLLLGGERTDRIRLLSGLTDTDDSYMLLSPHGAAYFPASLAVRHNFGEVLLSSYRTDSDDEGITIHKRLRLGSDAGPYLCAEKENLALHGVFTRMLPDSGAVERTALGTRLGYRYSAADTFSEGTPAGILAVDTDAAAVLFGKPVRSGQSFEIAGSATSLTDGVLSLSEGIFLSAGADGITHYGNTYLTGDVASARFTPGLAGTGWGVQHSAATGNTTATFDELTVRKRMRVYEFEIQKADVVGGALWISHSFRGDEVERIH
jgi:hypothetical protein